MLIKFGAIVVGGRGKLGGQVFSRNRGGDYMRNNATPVNPQTTFQMQQRAALAIFSRGWSLLTETQRAAWNAAVESFPKTNVFGDVKKLSGKNLYTSLNRNLQLVGGNVENTPPSPGPLGVPTGIIMDNFSATAADFQVEGTQLGDKIVIVSTGPVTAGTTFVKNRFRIIEVVTASDPETPVNAFPEYVSRFGSIAPGQKVFFGAYAINIEGQASPMVTVSAFAD